MPSASEAPPRNTHRSTRLFNTPCEFSQQARLADAWFSRNESYTQPTGDALLKLIPEAVKFALPSHQDRRSIWCSIGHDSCP